VTAALIFDDAAHIKFCVDNQYALLCFVEKGQRAKGVSFCRHFAPLVALQSIGKRPGNNGEGNDVEAQDEEKGVQFDILVTGGFVPSGDIG